MRSAEQRYRRRGACQGVEATGASAAELHAAADTNTPLAGDALLAIADRLDQVVDGYLRAFASGDPRPWLILCAVDGTSWDVASTSEEALKEVRKGY